MNQVVLGSLTSGRPPLFPNPEISLSLGAKHTSLVTENSVPVGMLTLPACIESLVTGNINSSFILQTTKVWKVGGEFLYLAQTGHQTQTDA